MTGIIRHCAFVLAACSIVMSASSEAKKKAPEKAETLSWELMGELDFKKGTATPKLKAFDGKGVRIPGFIVPLDFSEAREVSEFLLTPSYPGCIHVPPPTPAQTVLVKMDKGKKAKMSWGPVWVTGRLKIHLEKKSGYGEASFTLTGYSTEEYNLSEPGDSLVNQVITGSPEPTPKKPKAQ